MKLFDSKAGALVDFVPLTPGEVGIYVCGPTVQSAPHVGHLRSAVAFDIIARWLRIGHGYDVKLVRNVTDIDDKILVNAEKLGKDWRELAVEVEAGFNEVYESIGAGVENAPHATAHIAGMIEVIERLIEKGHAYQAENGSANVFFDTASHASYGELTRQKLENMEGEAIGGGRRAAHDFALWKAAKPGEPETASWDSPWGKGRPGWHIECTAIALEYLDPSDLEETLIDVQGGGSDLIFPHHEMCAAQAHVMTGKELAHSYVHTGMIGLDGEKMSKSKGNLVFVSRLVASGVDPMAIRWALMSDHYKADRMWSDAILFQAQDSIRQLKQALARDNCAPTTDLINVIIVALSNDLDTAQIVSALNAWSTETLNGSQGGNPTELRAVLDALLGLQL